jgi:hypothetical protein
MIYNKTDLVLDARELQRSSHFAVKGLFQALNGKIGAC